MKIGSVKDAIKVMGDNLRSALEEMGGRQRDDTRRGNYGWWDGEFKESKKEIRKMLREWRKGKRGRREYKEKKKEYRELCEKKEEHEKWERVVGEARQEEQVWEVNK